MNAQASVVLSADIAEEGFDSSRLLHQKTKKALKFEENSGDNNSSPFINSTITKNAFIMRMDDG